MPHYHTRRVPRALTEAEQRAVLRATADHRNGLRDHVLIAMALATGLRQHELLALDCGDVYRADGSVTTRVQLRVWKGCTRGPALVPQEVLLPETLRRKLLRLRAEKRRRGQAIESTAPVFISRNGNRLSPQRVRAAWTEWQRRAGLDRRFSFHELRHTAVTNLYRRTTDLRLSQRFARHASPITTSIYAHVADEALAAAIEMLPC